MPGIKRSLIRLVEGANYKAGRNDYVIQKEHTLNDILRFVVCQSGNDFEEIRFVLDEIEKELTA